MGDVAAAIDRFEASYARQVDERPAVHSLEASEPGLQGAEAGIGQHATLLQADDRGQRSVDLDVGDLRGVQQQDALAGLDGEALGGFGAWFELPTGSLQGTLEAPCLDGF